MTEEQVELGARALFELERSSPLGRFAFPESDWLAVAPVDQDRFRRQSRAVLRAALP